MVSYILKTLTLFYFSDEPQGAQETIWHTLLKVSLLMNNFTFVPFKKNPSYTEHGHMCKSLRSCCEGYGRGGGGRRGDQSVQ
jgi:hypothetical protein